jgi:hypothetical protein
MPQPQVRSPIHRRGPTWVPARSPAIPNLASHVSTSAASPCLRWRAQHKQEKAAACSLHERKEKPSPPFAPHERCTRSTPPPLLTYAACRSLGCSPRHVHAPVRGSVCQQQPSEEQRKPFPFSPTPPRRFSNGAVLSSSSKPLRPSGLPLLFIGDGQRPQEAKLPLGCPRVSCDASADPPQAAPRAAGWGRTLDHLDARTRSPIAVTRDPSNPRLDVRT